MSVFLRHEACPKCRDEGRDRSGNNLAIYADGSEYCFSCKYFRNGSGSHFPLVPLESSAPPTDLIHDLPNANLEWLRGKGLTDTEIYANFQYSPTMDRHFYITPVRPLATQVDSNMFFYEGRSIGDKMIKSLQWGSKPYSILGSWGDSGVVVIVEDIISAIKVKREWGVIPLFGSYMPIDILTSMCKMPTVDTVLWWLDADKYDVAMVQMRKCRILGKLSAVIVTDYDPKDYTTIEIKNEVDNAVDFCIEN